MPVEQGQGLLSQATPSLSPSKPFGSLAGPPAAMKASWAAAWLEKLLQSKSALD